MSALNFILHPEAVFILTDSLALDGDPKRSPEPFAFWTKIFPLPHLNAAIAGTGVAQVILDWFLDIQSQVVTDNILFLDRIAPIRLQEIAARYPSVMSTTVYHFGLDVENGAFRGFAYRGTNNFQSEELPHSFAMKPPLPEFLARFPKAIEEGS